MSSEELNKWAFDIFFILDDQFDRLLVHEDNRYY